MGAKPREGLELLLDAPMAGEQHLERVVECRGGVEKARARVPFHARWDRAPVRRLQSYAGPEGARADGEGTPPRAGAALLGS